MNCSECVSEILNRLTLYKQQLQQRRPRDVKVCVTHTEQLRAVSLRVLLRDFLKNTSKNVSFFQ